MKPYLARDKSFSRNREKIKGNRPKQNTENNCLTSRNRERGWNYIFSLDCL